MLKALKVKMDHRIYTKPESDLTIRGEAPSSKGKLPAIIGSLLMISLPLSVSGVYISIIQTYLAMKMYNAWDPRALSGAVSEILITLVARLIPVAIAFLLVAFSIFISGYRRPWLFKVCMLYAGFLALLVPVGSALSIICFVFLFRKKHSFYNAT